MRNHGSNLHASPLWSELISEKNIIYVNFCHSEYFSFPTFPIPEEQENWLPEAAIFASSSKERFLTHCVFFISTSDCWWLYRYPSSKPHSEKQKTLFRFYYPFFEILIFVLLVAWLVNSCNMSRPKYFGV